MRATALLLVTVLAAAASDNPLQRFLRVPVNVTGPQIAAVTPPDFSVALPGSREAAVVAVHSPVDDLMILVVMDTTGDLALVGPARTALAEAIRDAPKRTWAGLLRAQDGLHVILDPTNDRDSFEKSLMTMPVSGKAGLLDTVETAVALGDSIAEKSDIRVAVLYITDSDVRNYREDFTNPVINSSDSRDLSRRFPEGLVREKLSRLTESVSRNQTPVFMVHLLYSAERLNEAYQSGLMQLASATGGTALFCRSQSDVADAVARTVSALESQYTLVVQLPQKTPKIVTLTLGSENLNFTYRSRFLLR
jgi:hypothetical protein